MVRWYVLWSSLLLLLVGARPTLAGPISFTGITQTDFSPSSPAAQGNLNYASVPVLSSPTALGEDSFIPANGWVSGWAISSVNMSYDPTNNSMYVGLSSFKEPAFGNYAIFGDADGNGNPGGASAQMTAAGGIDSPNMGGDKAVVLAIAAANPNTTPTTPTIIAGIPSEKSLAGSGIDGFTVAHFNGSSGMLQNDFGSALSGVTGNLAFNPSSAHPELEFSISNFSASGINPSKGFWINLYAGSGEDVVAGEVGTGWVFVPPVQAQVIPEPTALLVWSGLAAGMAWAYRRRSRRLTS
jgi:hypothetical protein